MLEAFDPSSIEDEGLRQIFISLLNLVENLQEKVTEQAQETKRLRDENNRLKGEQGKPRILPNKPTTDLSSEKERRQSKPRTSRSKQDKIATDREVTLKVERSQLPQDAQFKGYEEVVIQDIAFHRDNIKFRRETYYSPSQKRSYLAPLPAGYSDQFGPAVKACVLWLYFSGRMRKPKILETLHTIGLQMSAGEL